MWSFNAKTIIFIALVPASISCLGQDIPGPLPCSKWVRFEIVLGRVTASEPRCRHNQRFATEKPDLGVQEVLTFASQSQVPSIHWERAAPEETFSLHLESGDVVLLKHAFEHEGKPVQLEYKQPKTGPVTFTILEDERSTTYKADTLWHLILLTPETCQTYLVPSLEKLRPHWQLNLQASRLRKQLLALAKRDWRPDREQLDEWVNQLAEGGFQSRQNADRELRKYGFAALSHIRNLDPQQLTPEQRSRIQKIEDGLRLEAGDTPYRISRWLSEDKEVWLSLLAHGEASVRQTAAIHLSKLCDRPIDFDPLAAGSERRLQIDRLSLMLATD